MLRVTNTPSLPHKKKVVEWNKAYLNTSDLADEDEYRVYFVDGDECLGYAELDYEGSRSTCDHVSLSWFCAPRNGQVCLTSLLTWIQTNFTECRRITLSVSCGHDEHPKAGQARLNLYFLFGFKIFDTIRGEHWQHFRMEKILKD